MFASALRLATKSFMKTSRGVKGGVKLDHRGGGKADQGSGWRSRISGEGGGWSGGLRSGL
jgi:hypothetical protein